MKFTKELRSKYLQTLYATLCIHLKLVPKTSAEFNRDLIGQHSALSKHEAEKTLEEAWKTCDLTFWPPCSRGSHSPYLTKPYRAKVLAELHKDED